MTHKYDLKIIQAGVPKWIQMRSDSEMEQDEVLYLALQACFSDINGDYSGLEVWGDHLKLVQPSDDDEWLFKGNKFNGKGAKYYASWPFPEAFDNNGPVATNMARPSWL